MQYDSWIMQGVQSTTAVIRSPNYFVWRMAKLTINTKSEIIRQGAGPVLFIEQIPGGNSSVMKWHPRARVSIDGQRSDLPSRG